MTNTNPASKDIKFFDSHLHIIDPRFPLYENQGYIPKPYTTDDYLKDLTPYHMLGGAVVSGSFQQQDQDYLVEALRKLGKNYVGVTQLLANTPDAKIIELNTVGVRAVRFNLMRGGSEDFSNISNFAARIHELANWHIELYVDGRDLASIYTKLTKLPKISIDHLGLRKEGLHTLLRLTEKGAHVKATGFGRLDFNPAIGLSEIHRSNPHSLMFGSDLPCTRAPRAFSERDIALIGETLGNEAAERVFYKNALDFYSLE